MGPPPPTARAQALELGPCCSAAAGAAPVAVEAAEDARARARPAERPRAVTRARARGRELPGAAAPKAADPYLTAPVARPLAGVAEADFAAVPPLFASLEVHRRERERERVCVCVCVAEIRFGKEGKGV